MKIIAVTNRKICSEDFFTRIRKIANLKPYGIILREKDLNKSEFYEYAYKCKEICNKLNVKLIINTFTEVALQLNILNIQLSFNNFINLSNEVKQKYISVGVSIHSIEEAIYAENHNADYLIAGHIYQTNCKKGLPGRGIKFLRQICENVSIPVYGIGGINLNNAIEVINAGADAVCLMSEFMSSKTLITKF